MTRRRERVYSDVKLNDKGLPIQPAFVVNAPFVIRSEEEENEVAQTSHGFAENLAGGFVKERVEEPSTGQRYGLPGNEPT